MRKIFLDDIRDPKDCIGYMYTRVGAKNLMYLDGDWMIVRNYDDFVKAVKKEHPILISFDRDLGEDVAQYESKNGILSKRKARAKKKEVKTGEDCATWLKGYCKGMGLPLPECWIHSMNPVGVENIKNILNT